jgi:hypothetical protein
MFSIPNLSVKYHYIYQYQIIMNFKILQTCFSSAHYYHNEADYQIIEMDERYLLPFSVPTSGVDGVFSSKGLEFIFEKQIYYKLKHEIWSDYSHEFFSEEHIKRINRQKQYELDSVFCHQINKTITYENLIEFDIIVSFTDYIIIYIKSLKIIKNIIFNLAWLQTVFYFIMIYLSCFKHLVLLGYFLIFSPLISIKLNYQLFNFYLFLVFLWIILGIILGFIFWFFYFF